MNSSLRYQIAITLIPGIGNILAKNLIAYIGDVEGVFRESKKNLAKIPSIGEVRAAEIVNQHVLEQADKEIEFIQKNNLFTYYFTDNTYPFRLKECADSPIILYGKGDMHFNQGKFVGVVGTRNPSDFGKEYCTNFVSELAQKQPQVTIVSGLAYGIDITAHKAALENGLPTIIVPGHGLDRIYPAVHRSTAVKALTNGGIVTEFRSGTNPDRQNFVQRNRIIAGLCDAVVVVESKKEGGSLITAELANSYNRDVFAFPGRPGDVYAAGCNSLIKRNQAALIENTDDFLRYMSWNAQNTPAANVQTDLFADLSEDEELLLKLLRLASDGIHVNELSIKSGKTFSQVSSCLLAMEFKGLVKPVPGGIYKAVK